MAKIDRELLIRAVQENIEKICNCYRPTGKRNGNDWVIGNLDGDAGQSLRIGLEGETAGVYNDLATGEKGNAIDLIKVLTGKRYKEACLEIGQFLGINIEEPGTTYRTGKNSQGPRYQTSNSTKPFQWDEECRLSSIRVDEVCPWRGYHEPFVIWADEHRHFGCTKKGEWAFPVVVDGTIVAAHIRQRNGKWRYCPALQDLGIKITPLIVGELATAEKVFIGESPWDIFAILDRLGIQHGEPIAGIVTRSASNAGLVATVELRAEVEIYVVPQNDDPGRSWAQSVETTLTREFRLVTVPTAPTQYKDANDWLKALGDNVGTLVEAIQNAEVRQPKKKEAKVYIEFHRPSYYVAYDPPPDLVLAGDNHIVRGSIVVLAGPGGVGKSRAITASAVSGALRTPWFGLEVYTNYKTMVIQAENGRFRLKKELSGINEPRLEDYLLICPPPQFGLCFGHDKFKDQLKKARDEFGPMWVWVDPWNATSPDDKMRDYRETLDLICEVLNVHTEAGPVLGIAAHTRKPIIGERASGRALLNLVAGSYLLGSAARCVFILQSASDRVDEERVVFTCCKNNDGQLGPRSAWRRKNDLFVPVKDFDWDEWDHPSDGRSSGKLKGTIDDLLALIPVAQPIKREELYAKGAGIISRDDIRNFISELLRDQKIYLHKIPNPGKGRSFTGYAQTPPPNTGSDLGADLADDDDIDIEDDPR